MSHNLIHMLELIHTLEESAARRYLELHVTWRGLYSARGLIVETTLIIAAAWIIASLVIAVAWSRFFSGLKRSAKERAEEAEATEAQAAPRPARLQRTRVGWGQRAIRGLVQRFSVGHPR
jgi:hypothetical protein